LIVPVPANLLCRCVAPDLLAPAAACHLSLLLVIVTDMASSRRTFLKSLAAAAAAASLRGATHAATTCPFHLAVINDELTPDFGRACEIASKDFGLQWIELRSMWGKNVTDLDAKEIAESRRLLQKYNLRVTDIASPLFKVDWPGAPLSKESPKHDQFHAGFDFKQQDQLLDHCIDLAKQFQTDRVRCFDFWRLDNQAPYRAAINEKLRGAAEKCAKNHLILLLENEMACNTANGEESAAVLKAIPNPSFMLNWDPGNAAALGSTPYPDGYRLLPKKRIGHCHVKDVMRPAGKKYEWAPVGAGVVDWVGQFRALARDGYHHAVSLETHWRGAGTAEASTRISMQGLKSTLSKAGLPC
jgi:L-ribulose-5-phosphate 3-epimerase